MELGINVVWIGMLPDAYIYRINELPFIENKFTIYNTITTKKSNPCTLAAASHMF